MLATRERAQHRDLARGRRARVAAAVARQPRLAHDFDRDALARLAVFGLEDLRRAAGAELPQSHVAAALEAIAVGYARDFHGGQAPAARYAARAFQRER